MDIEIISLFPGYFKGPFDESIIRRAREKKLLNIRHTNLRDFCTDKHKRVDDRPFGGGPGMVLKPEPMVRAIQSVKRPASYVVHLSPQGKTLDHETSRRLSKKEHIILLCGHYEGVDERILQEVDEEISIGDFVLTNGALAAIVCVDAVCRFVPGVLGDAQSSEQDSFSGGILDSAHYTRPAVCELTGAVPEVLLSGNHEDVARWRKQQSLTKTQQVRPDLYLSYLDRVGAKSEEEEFALILPVTCLTASARFYRKELCLFQEELGDCWAVFSLSDEKKLLLIEAYPGDKVARALFRYTIKKPGLFGRVKANMLRAGVVIKEKKDGSLIVGDIDGHAWVICDYLEGEQSNG